MEKERPETFLKIIQTIEIFLFSGGSGFSPCLDNDLLDSWHTVWSLSKQMKNNFISCSLYYFSPSQHNDYSNTFLLVYKLQFSAAFGNYNAKSLKCKFLSYKWKRWSLMVKYIELVILWLICATIIIFGNVLLTTSNNNSDKLNHKGEYILQLII